MAHPDLREADLGGLVPPQAAAAFRSGEEKQALTLLRRARDRQAPASGAWAVLERLTGLVLIHLQREVEGTFALERADAVLDALGAERPSLAWLEDDAPPDGER